MPPSPRLRTAAFTPADRQRLGEAVVTARKALGYDEPGPFAKLATVSARALWSVENAEPTVGEKVLERIARAIPWWSAETPRLILEGATAPPAPPAQPATRPEFSLEIQARLDRIGRALGYEAYVEARDLLREAQKDLGDERGAS